MTLDDIATKIPDWEVIMVYHDYLIDHDQPLQAEALMWLKANKVWPIIQFDMARLYIQGSNHRWFVSRGRQIDYWLPRAFSGPNFQARSEIRAATIQEVLLKFFQAYAESRDGLAICYSQENDGFPTWLPAYEDCKNDPR